MKPNYTGVRQKIYDEITEAIAYGMTIDPLFLNTLSNKYSMDYTNVYCIYRGIFDNKKDTILFNKSMNRNKREFKTESKDCYLDFIVPCNVNEKTVGRFTHHYRNTFSEGQSLRY